MKTTEIRDRLHMFIDNVDDKKLKAIYTIVEDDIEEIGEYSAEFKAELDRRYEEYKKDGKFITREEMAIRVDKLLAKAK